MELQGANAVVTGGSSGIGAAVVAALRVGGCRVAVLDLNAADGHGDLAVECDVSDEQQVVTSMARAHAGLGGLDIAVLNAGVGGMSSILGMESTEWDRVLGINLRGTFLCLRESARVMAHQGRGGAIVAVSSVCGVLADRRTAHYNVSKAGIDMLVRIAARELGPRGIRVNAVAPGLTDTPTLATTAALPGYRERVTSRTALGRLGAPADIAEVVSALVALDWVTGEIVTADGGVSLWSPIDPMEGRDGR